MEGKFIFNQTLTEKSTSGSSTILQRIFKPQGEEEHEIYSQVLESSCAIFGDNPTNLQDFPLNVAILEPIHERLRMGFILADKGSRRLHKDGDEQKCPTNERFDTVFTATNENIDRTQRCIQYANIAGLEHISLVKNYVAE